LSQGGRMKSQSRDWACNVVGYCPSKRGRHCILQRVAKILISKEGHNWKGGKNKYVTSEIGWKSGISSRQRECTGILKVWSWNSCHEEVKEGWAIVIGTKGLGA
jgi:hypothetical protein